jgi:hypothetical protein
MQNLKLITALNALKSLFSLSIINYQLSINKRNRKLINAQRTNKWDKRAER